MISAETLYNKLSAMKLHYIRDKADIFMADMSRSLQLTQNSMTDKETGEEKYLFLLFSGELCLLTHLIPPATIVAALFFLLFFFFISGTLVT